MKYFSDENCVDDDAHSDFVCKKNCAKGEEVSLIGNCRSGLSCCYTPHENCEFFGFRNPYFLCKKDCYHFETESPFGNCGAGLRCCTTRDIKKYAYYNYGHFKQKMEE